MPTTDWQKIEAVFLGALELAPAERNAWLDQECDRDATLRREVESLLNAEFESAAFLRGSALPKAARLLLDETETSLIGQQLGPYKILDELGRGGMGVVYLAEREDDQFHQRVAIKLIKRGLDTEDILRRFRNERQILASLNHPNIGKLFDGGTTADGLPYFVMEYIAGLPLLQYCDEHDLSTTERLQLFRRVCAAVQHAHQNLIIHRDLKPSNILVSESGEVKLLDFGVAKLLNPELTETALTQTHAALRVMTPEYASPEQVRGEHVTTATDVYSLGVILYQLLTGARPYTLKDTSPEELSQMICGYEPARPSDAVSSQMSDASSSQETDLPRTKDNGRKPNPQFTFRNPKSLRGDLDNICLMALRKDPARRYKSVEQFSEDIERHLKGLPVIARKDTFKYRAAKFIARNKIAVAAACLVGLTLLGGIIATTWEARKARAQARIANAKSAEAQQALTRTEKISGFLQSVFSYANPQWFGRGGGKGDMTVAEAMRDVERRIDTEFADDPSIRADLHQQIGDTYRTQGLVSDAERNLREALRLRLQLYGEDNAKVAESMYILSGVRDKQGDLSEEQQLITRALEIQRRHPNDGHDLPYMLVDYATFLFEQKADYAKALELNLEALAEFRARYGENHHMVLALHAALAQNYFAFGDYPKSEAEIQGVLKAPDQSFNFSTLNYLAQIQIIRGNYTAAEIAIKEMLSKATAPDSSREQMTVIHLAQSFMAYRQGSYAQSTEYAGQAFAAQPSAENSGLLAENLNQQGQAKRAESLSRAAIESLKKSSTVDNVMTLAFLQSVLGESLSAQHRFADAEGLLLSAYETQKAHVLPQQYEFVVTRERLAELYRAWGKTDEAKKYV